MTKVPAKAGRPIPFDEIRDVVCRKKSATEDVLFVQEKDGQWKSRRLFNQII